MSGTYCRESRREHMVEEWNTCLQATVPGTTTSQASKKKTPVTLTSYGGFDQGWSYAAEHTDVLEQR
ncbi:MAG: hypothetical protein BMS9Abin15_0580 [Gammaproteobacteria bacterium]|nr:MAG: hypothetical protein BMS9Abin15_0580 [Gammaproteobacteria bacterium]